MTTSTEVIRSVFPALRRVVDGAPVAYFDGPGGTQVAQPVLDAMRGYLVEHNANTHWAYPSSVETDAALAHARATFAALFNGRPEDVVFGANMTTLTYHLSRAVGRSMQPGDEIVVTELDHHANVDPWRALEQERGVVVRAARMIPDSGLLDMDHLEGLIGPRTRLVAVGAASNAIGTINDVTRAVQLAHDVGALAFVDGVHFTPHRLPDVSAIGCDFFACSAYKFYGPHVGIMYARSDVVRDLDFPHLQPAPSAPPERAETGTLNHEGIVGAAAAVEWLGSLSSGGSLREQLSVTFDALHTRGEKCGERLWSLLDAIPGIRLVGPPPGRPRTPTV
ncbi:MAG: aminotransferase class V-fold PLP-dependent enzyme, partial [Rhodothermales bacterium]|nr:aminotransferase class V-fold PLP-dependent enzyme [Rhodothermales bacterium]